MSIATEITRLQNAKASIKTSIENKGVTVPSTTKLDGYPALIDSIPTGSQVTVEPLSVTQNGTYQETGKAYSPVTVNVQGGAGLDLPKFTEIWSNDWETLISVTCDKTFAECLAYINDGFQYVSLSARTQDGSEVYENSAFPHATLSGQNEIRYTVIFSGAKPEYDIKYEPNGTISEVSPSVIVDTLNITQNGTYPSDGFHFIEEVNVNVPSTTISPLSVTTNGTYTAPSGTAYSPVTVNVQGGGGGASNFVTGEFTVPTYSSSVKYGEVSIPYTGNGYPISALVFVKGGVYNSTSTGESTWYTGIKRYAVGYWSMIKSNTTTAPDYNSTVNDNATVVSIYKNSTSLADNYTRTSAMGTMIFSTSNPATNSALCIVFRNNVKTLRYAIGNGSASSYGLYPQVTYVYQIVYSE